MSKNIGFISTRFAGTDGVTLEASKWAQVFRQMGHQCFWFAGQLDRSPERSMLVEEAFFQHSQNQRINARVLGRKARSVEVTDKIQALKSFLKEKLYQFIERFTIDLLVPQNALTIPMHVPWGSIRPRVPTLSSPPLRTSWAFWPFWVLPLYSNSI
jgi:hypothetical protein